ncbi:hypothetical protein HNY73_006932 [Argiope bruennichi]|uniref:Uncharacterized protein n=1 Tax=Argiope bruennichi TaxID=94029 RepID=A0A8T0FEV0_ARGBR|nr:hypothetical protein HNY73_006932 [Argiope bruennichi]
MRKASTLDEFTALRSDIAALSKQAKLIEEFHRPLKAQFERYKTHQWSAAAHLVIGSGLSSKRTTATTAEWIWQVSDYRENFDPKPGDAHQAARGGLFKRPFLQKVRPVSKIFKGQRTFWASSPQRCVQFFVRTCGDVSHYQAP